jgi:hypothetical protein
MKVVIRLSAKQEAKALPILLRHSPGTVLPGRTYVISEEAARALRAAGVGFTELANEGSRRFESSATGARKVHIL